jgi:hypothetical protein
MGGQLTQIKVHPEYLITFCLTIALKMAGQNGGENGRAKQRTPLFELGEAADR